MLSAGRHQDCIGELARPLFDGFEYLLEQVQLLSHQHANLERKLALAQASYHNLAAKYASSDDAGSESTDARHQIGDVPDMELTYSEYHMMWTHIPLRKDHDKDEEAVQKVLLGMDACDTIKRDLGWSARRVAGHVLETRKPASAHGSPRPRLSQPGTDFERDFTTPGIEGNLQCPFATMTSDGPSSHASSRPQTSTLHRSGGLPTPPNRRGSHTIVDPIEAEFHADDFSSPPPSVTGSASKCPIRFLDQHSPEEVAKYFENHKHEIPRSHEVCVKRYQSNTESIRLLDAKYGSLVSMIQGLGMKHQPLLPANEEQQMLDEDRKSTDRVGKWAEAISERLDGHQEGIAEDEQEERKSHFDRPLKEIRVGESPSRPWGISVPAVGEPAISPFSLRESGNGEEHHLGGPIGEILQETDSKGHTGKCPFGFDRKGSSLHPGTRPPVSVAHDPAASASHGKPQPNSRSTRQEQQPSQMVFTGPVFIGYPTDQAIALLQQSGMGMNPAKV
ncbi:MAG: hypothetical protein M1830_010211 [Pleopsidium flavum]|nr:MAG: hypothetical protein M1830_010211 [Pleopsidium flavum]